MSNEDKYESLRRCNQVCFPLYACSKEIIRRYKPFLDEIDLTYTQYITMMVLWEKNTVNVKTLGECLYLDSGTLTDFRGNFEAFRASKNESRSNETKSNSELQRVKKQKPKRPQSAERTIAKLEREISLCESRKADIEKLKEQYSSDYAKLMELESSEAEIDTELDALYEKWEELIENQ